MDIFRLWCKKIRFQSLSLSAIVAATCCVIATPAFAHYVYEKHSFSLGPNPKASIANSTDGCIESRLETSHGGTGAGYYKTEATLLGPSGGGILVHNCEFAHPNLPAGELAVKQKHERWNEYTSQWEVCTATGWVFNAQGNPSVKVVVEERNGTPHCGDGWYNNVSIICGWSPNLSAGWSCQSQNSGVHYLPN